MRDAKHDADSSMPGVDLKQGSSPGLQQNLFADACMELEGAPDAKADRKSVDNAQGRSSALPEVTGMAKSNPPVFIEACAGCGILSQTAKARGFKVLPIDCARNRHHAKCKIYELDLSQPHAIELLKRICCDMDVICVHIALPCGTCSKARGIPLPDGSPGPAPLRSWSHLYGLPGISGTDAIKLEAANRLYIAIAEFIEFLESEGIPWTVENPGNSWLWELPCMAWPIANASFYHLHACAYGGLRKKDTAFLASREEFHALSKFCDGSHQHEGWGYDHELGVFNTSKEAEYPRQLCEAYTDVLVELAQQKGYSIPTTAADAGAIKPQQQRTGRKLPQLIPEYLTVLTALVDTEPTTDDKHCLVQPVGNAPKGAKLLRSEAKGGKLLCVFGLYRSMHEFVELSRQLWHPYDELVNLPDEIIKCLFTTLRASMEELTKKRIRTLQRWTSLAKQCAAEEQLVQDNLSEEVRTVLRGKRLVLLEKLADEVDWPDKSIHEELRQGFMLTGYVPPTGVFKADLKPAKMDKAQLMKDSKFLRPLILGKLKHASMDTEDEQTLYDITLEEAQGKGWLHGPYSPEEISFQQGGTWLPVRRFGIWQKGKFRPIDDMKENHLNDCLTSCDKIDLHAMDHVLWSLCIALKFCLFHESMSFKLSDGTVLQSEVHPTWRARPPSFKITSFDLASAYKQLPLNPEEYNCTVVTLRNPSDNTIKCFYMRTLPFGSIASVVHFNRISRLLWRLGLALGILWGNYFDDYPCITHSDHNTSTMACVQSLFKILGFAFAEDKLLPFEDRAEMLGVEVNLANAMHGTVVVDNKPQRKVEISEAISEIISEGGIVPSKLPSILGRMQFADMQLSGKLGKLAMADVREMGTESKVFVPLTEEIRKALSMLKVRMESGKPRVLHISPTQRPWILFTDGAYEPNRDTAPNGLGVATIGGVLFAPTGDARVFGCNVDESLLSQWLQDFSHPIGLIELYAIAVAYNLWGPMFGDQKILIFGDNWAANDTFIKGTSSVKAWRSLLLQLERLDDSYNAMAWMARVPSASNIADPPSRGSIEELKMYAPVIESHITCPVTGNVLKAFLHAEADEGIHAK